MADVKKRNSERGGVFADLPELETERLLLRRMRLDDAEAMFAYASDPEVTRYVLFDTHRSIEDSREFLRFATEGYERGDFGGWGLLLKDSGVFIGPAASTPATRQSTPAPSWATSSRASTGGGASCPRPCGRSSASALCGRS